MQRPAAPIFCRFRPIAPEAQSVDVRSDAVKLKLSRHQKPIDRRVRDTREIATCFFSPTGKRGSLICLRAGVFVNGRARPVDPKRGRCSEKGAELTREVLARAFARSLGVV